jgi:hypothetical protein
VADLRPPWRRDAGSRACARTGGELGRQPTLRTVGLGAAAWVHVRWRRGHFDELTGDDFADRSSRQRRAVLPVAATVALVLGVLVANRRVAGLGDLVASGLLPAPDTLGTAVRAYLAESGNGGDHPAWLGLAALASVPFVVPGWATAAAVLLGVPAAALACAWYLSRP